MPEFEWDKNKNKTNIEKHGIGFDTARRIFESPILTWIDNRHNYGEIRRHSIGTIQDIVVLTVIHTDRDGKVRIISARRANSSERKKYEEAIQQRT
ncbi:MAG: BrnT family toxin [Alphaproteobacteria bacterium]|nr:BrnT family toxin [Alphaproteobacteria bacterium]